MRRILITFWSLVSLSTLFAQTIGVSITESGADPDSSAMLHIQSSSKGLLIPRMDSISREGISNAAQGLMVYDTTTSSFWYYTQTFWQEIGKGGTVQGDGTNLYSLQVRDEILTGNVRGEGAVDLQAVKFLAQEVASGQYSVIGGGVANTASGIGALVAGGAYNEATGLAATIGGGDENNAGGVRSTVSGGRLNAAQGSHTSVGGGFQNGALGSYSTVPGGRSNSAFSYGETVVGIFSEEYTPQSATAFNGNDRLFVVGNGLGGGNRSNALTLLKNGNLGLGTSTPDSTLHIVGGFRLEDGNQQAGYVLTSNANGGASWQAAGKGGIWDQTAPNGVTYTLNAGHVVDGVHSLVAGNDNEVDADYTFVAGRSNRVFASQSAVLGGGHFVSSAAISSYVFGTTDTATGGVSFVFGQDNRTDASFSLAVGDGNKLTSGATWSSAIGQNNSVSNAYAFALGSNLVTPAVNETVLGAYNELYTPASNGWNANDRLFSIGNGQSLATRSNALTLLKNGNLGLGTSKPDTTLHVVGQMRYEDGNQQLGYVLTSDANGVATWQSNAGIGGTVQGTGGNVYNLEVTNSFGPAANIRGQHSVDLQSARNSSTHIASGNFSTLAGGLNNTASGSYATVGGGFANLAGGERSTVSGGQGNRAIGDYAAILGGFALQAESYIETVVGTYNLLSGGSPSTWVGNEPLFVVGNGTSTSSRSNAMTILKNGRIGIGTPTPANTLHIVGSQPSTQGVATMQNTNQTGAAVTYYNDYNGVRRGYIGWINSTANNLLGPGTFQMVAGGASIFLNPVSGNIGIGTATPTRGRLEVSGATSYQIPNQIGFLNNNNTPVGSGVPQSPSPYSIYATDRIAGESFNAHSDIRIKHIQGLSDSRVDLSILMQLEVTDYRLRDSIAKGNRPIKKVIAQQVAEVYPQAVNTDLTEVVPDIYQRAKMEDGWIMLATNLQIGEHVKLITEHSTEVYEVIAAEPNRFQVSSLTSDFSQQSGAVERSEIPFTETSKVFVYGREVNDFHTVDYEAISMLNVSATQELQRIIEAQQGQIKAQQAEIEALKNQNVAIHASFDARLQALEVAKVQP
ncbi:MAG: tail fiber domain-containing protein [Bacteroidota bacterium]